MKKLIPFLFGLVLLTGCVAVYDPSPIVYYGPPCPPPVVVMYPYHYYHWHGRHW